MAVVTVNSYDIVADAVRKYWKKTYVQDVIAFFYQKYDFDSDDEWEWCEEYIYPESSTDYETVNFMMDFCEGQTCVKNLVVVSFDRVTAFFTANHFKKKTDDLISRQRILDKLDWFISIGVKGKDGRTPISAETFRDFVEAEPIIQPEQKPGRWIETDDYDAWRCSECDEYFCLDEGTPQDNEYYYCPNCGARMVNENE